MVVHSPCVLPCLVVVPSSQCGKKRKTRGGKRPPGGNTRVRQPSFTGRCHRCKEVGHRVADCPMTRKEARRQKEEKEAAEGKKEPWATGGKMATARKDPKGSPYDRPGSTTHTTYRTQPSPLKGPVWGRSCGLSDTPPISRYIVS